MRRLLASVVLLTGCSHLAAPAATARMAARAPAALAKAAGQVRGIGGIFQRSTSPAALCDWYSKHLGLAAKPDQGTWFFWQLPGVAQGFSTMWFIFPAATTYFNGPCMIDYVVDDLEALMARLKAEGVKTAPKIVSDEGGKFGWAYDGDGNKFELFEPAIAVTPLPHGHVLGIGGLSLKLATPDWYAQHLGLAQGTRFTWQLPGNPPAPFATTWDAYPQATAPFNGTCMVDYLVDDLQAVTASLKAAGVDVEADPGGKLAWAHDGDGNKFELEEPAR